MAIAHPQRVRSATMATFGLERMTKRTILIAIAFTLVLVAVAALYFRLVHLTGVRKDDEKWACVSKLRSIDLAKEKWTVANNGTNGQDLAWADVLIYLPQNEVPQCPSGGKYDLRPIGYVPKCSVGGEHCCFPGYPEQD